MRKGIRKVSYVSVMLVFTLVMVTSATAGATPNHAVQPKQQTSPYGSSWINVTAKEKYGTKDHPQYRPLGNVTLTLWTCNPIVGLPSPLLQFLKWRRQDEASKSGSFGPTNDEGKFVITSVYIGSYRLFAHKDGYVDLHSRWGVSVGMDGNPGSATVTLTAKGSAWDSSVT